MPTVRILLAAAMVAATAAAPAAAASPATPHVTALKNVLLVGNSQTGSVSFIDENGFAVLGSFNVIPDLQQRINEMDPIQRIGYETVKGIEGGDRFVDDAALSPDDRTLYVSRGNLDDVAAFDLATHAELWHTRRAQLWGHEWLGSGWFLLRSGVYLALWLAVAAPLAGCWPGVRRRGRRRLGLLARRRR